jgi:hypothetical protein
MLLIDGTIDPISGGHMVSHFRELVPKARVTELREIGHYDRESLSAPQMAWARRDERTTIMSGSSGH